MDTEFIQSGFVQVVPKNNKDAQKIAKELNQKGAVWKAFVAPRRVPAVLSGSQVGSRNFEPSQGYIDSAPDGIGVPNLAKANESGLNEHEKDLRRYMQVILPAWDSPAEYVGTVRSWPCVEEAHAAPEVSLPGLY